MTNDMTKGSPIKLILSFMVPLLIGNIFQQFYNMADTIIVGRTISVEALAAVGATGSISFLIVGFVQGVTSGFAVITAQRFGAGSENGVRRSVATSIILGIAVTIVMTAISVLAARPLLEIMKTPSDIIDDSYNYIIVIFEGIAAAVFLNADIKPGIEIVLNAVNLAQAVQGAALVITGEGRIDSQTAGGKAPLGVASVAKQFNVPVIGIAGVLGDGVEVVHQYGIDAVFSILPRLAPLAEVLASGETNLFNSARNIACAIKIGQGIKN